VSEALLKNALLISILAAGAAIRLWQINALGFNTDEAVYAGQAAAMARVPYLKDLFPIFRAHPLLFQFLTSLIYKFEVNDLWPRVLGVAFGLATVFMVYLLGSLLYGPKAGLISALFLAFMPYHVIVTRQALLDGPLAFFATLTLYLLARYAATKRAAWLYAAAAGMGLTFLAKETGIILLGSIYAFLALARHIRIRIVDMLIAGLLVGLTAAPYAAALIFSGAAGTGQNYLIWQLFRQANHPMNFYLVTVPPVLGYLVILVALLGLVVLYRQRSWRETLLVWWIIVPVVFFQLWPTKGFQYLLPIAPALAVLAARTLARWSPIRPGPSSIWRRLGSILYELTPGIVALSLLFTSLLAIRPFISTAFTAGTGGVPGVRSTGQWFINNAPRGAVVLTIGPSMANLVRFYGYRTAYGLSVSPNPLYRNPSYTPVLNPDLQIRNGDIQYLVWDSFSAARSKFFADTLLRLVQRFNGRVVHTESIEVTMPNGSVTLEPVIVVYEVHR
jgi:4-amino-4-deoxy-L-arabinose transferase-like glycosyltransferase